MDQKEMTGSEQRREQRTPAELAEFCGLLAVMLQDGKTPADGLETLARNQSAADRRDGYTALKQELERGKGLADAMEQAAVFPSFLTAMVRFGERAGALGPMLGHMAEHYRREERLRGRMLRSIGYPALLLGMLFVVLMVLYFHVMPQYREVFSALGEQFPGGGEEMLRVGGTVMILLAVLILGVLIALGAMWIYGRATGRRPLMALLSRGTVSNLLAAGQFFEAMFHMTEQGMPDAEALQICAEHIEDRLIREHLEGCRDRVQEGASLYDALKEADLFSDRYMAMLDAGIQTGTLPAAMREIARDCEAQAERGMERRSGVLEPVMVALFAVSAGVSMLAVVLPLVDTLTRF